MLTAYYLSNIILSTFNSTKSMMDSIQGLRPDGRLMVMGADAEPLSVSLIVGSWWCILANASPVCRKRLFALLSFWEPRHPASPDFCLRLTHHL
jgi:hypothetical protein